MRDVQDSPSPPPGAPAGVEPAQRATPEGVVTRPEAEPETGASDSPQARREEPATPEAPASPESPASPVAAPAGDPEAETAPGETDELEAPVRSLRDYLPVVSISWPASWRRCRRIHMG